MRINNNIAALNTHRQYSINNAAIAKSTEKLSSGYRINRAGDDAAGLAISEKMRAQIRGLNMASKNSQDAISLVQTAEGALQESHNILQRMRELAVQSASDTNETTIDRDALNKEYQQLIAELDDTANKTRFNDMNLIDGTFQASQTAVTGFNGQMGIKGITVNPDVISTGVHTIEALYTPAVKAVTAATGKAAENDLSQLLNNSAVTSVKFTMADNTATGTSAPNHQADDTVIQITGVENSGNTVKLTLTSTPDGGTAETFTAEFEVPTTGTTISVGNFANGHTLDLGITEGATVDEVVAALNGLTGTSITTAGGAGEATVNLSAAAYVNDNDAWDVTSRTLGTALEGSYSLSITQKTDSVVTVALTKDGAADPSYSFDLDLATAVAGFAAWTASNTDTSNVVLDFGDELGKLTLQLANAGGLDVTVPADLTSLINSWNDALTGKELILQNGADTVAGTTASEATAKITVGGKDYAIEDGTFSADKKSITFDDGFTLNFAEAFDADKHMADANSFNKFLGLQVDATDKNKSSASFTVTDIEGKEFIVQTGANQGDELSINIDRMDSEWLGVNADISNIATREAASLAITQTNDAINTVSTQRAALGALQNRLTHKIANLDTSAENLQSAESRIRDVDMASEMTEFTRNNILSQAATAMLAQANAAPQGVLQLLG